MVGVHITHAVPTDRREVKSLGAVFPEALRYRGEP